MELRHLKYFVAVVEEQSFTRAAEKLFIAQPPLSRQVQNLESELGIQLFERGSRPLQTTAAGHYFYKQALKILSQTEESKSMAKRVALQERTVNIGFVGSLLYGLLPRIIHLLRQQRPNIQTELVEMTASEQIQALKEGIIDVGFSRTRLSDSSIRRVLLREERLMVAVHSSHQVASMQSGVSLEQLVNESVFLYPRTNGPGYSSQVKALFTEYGLEPRHLREVREIQLALGLAAAGEGICIVPESAQMMHFRHLSYLPLLEDAAVSPIFLTMRDMDESEDIRALLDCVYQVYDLEAIRYDRVIL